MYIIRIHDSCEMHPYIVLKRRMEQFKGRAASLVCIFAHRLGKNAPSGIELSFKSSRLDVKNSSCYKMCRPLKHGTDGVYSTKERWWLQKSYIIVHISDLIIHTSQFIFQSLYLTLRSSNFIVHTSHLMVHTSHFKFYTRHPTVHSSYFTVFASLFQMLF